ncbi:MAG: hypothetical protein V4683_05035 [Bacteroidota bacterium]
MEKAYKNIVYFFLIIIAITLMGFSKTYFVHFPDFIGIKTIHHIHAFTLVLWFAMLIVQPILIQQHKYDWHRLIGKFSYILVPIIFILMLMVYKNQYSRQESMGISHAENLSVMFIPFTDTYPFVIYYILAIINKKNIAKHLRYMISTSVILLSPGLTRIFIFWFGMDFMDTVTPVSVVMLVVFAGLILYDRSLGKSIKKNPFTIALTIILIPTILMRFVPNTVLWHSIAEAYVKIIP